MRPIRAQDLRPEDVGAVIELSTHIAGRLVDVEQWWGFTTLTLETGEGTASYDLLNDELVSLDTASWTRINSNADRRHALSKGLIDQYMKTQLSAIIRAKKGGTQ